MENSPLIALVDDDALFRESLILNLTAVGYAVRGWEDGSTFLAALATQSSLDLVLLDWKMPGLNGIEVLARLRALRPELPVIFLTVLGEQVFVEEAALLGGAVDFVEKSRGFTILERRIRIILGRVPGVTPSSPGDRIVIGDLILDSESRRAFWRNRPVDLTVTEFAMVLALAGKAGRDVGFRPLYDAERLLGRPYWRVPEIQAAALIYAVMALLVLSIFTDAWTNLRRFRAVARAVVAGENRGSFAEANRVPDLAEVAREFDTMVATLRRSEALIRQAAEENAHALKAPLAEIAQAIEPLRRDLPADSVSLRRSVELISLSVDRLDALVSTGRRIDETIASLVDCPRHRINLSALLSTLGQGFARFAEERGLRFEIRVSLGLVVIGGTGQIEVIAENLIDNAFDFSPPGGTVTLELRRSGPMAEMILSDQGPGIRDLDINQIFERSVSRRQDGAEHDGLPADLVTPPPPVPEGLILPQAEELIRASGATLRLGGDQAFYSPGLDYIQVPRPESYFEPINWHRTALHELGHWTVHPARLNRNLSGSYGCWGWTSRHDS